MKRHLKLATSLAFVAALFGTVGCAGDRPTLQDRRTDWVDPCWLPRYSAAARRPVMDTFGAQIANGQEQDKTLMNYHFEQGTAELNPAGRAKLDYLLRQRPTVDGNLNLQTARDISYDAQDPNKYASLRSELDTKRVASIQQYVTTSTTGRVASVNIAIKDPNDIAMNSNGPAGAVRNLPTMYMSGIGATGGGGAITGVGGGAAPGGGAGGAPGGGAPGAGGAPPR